jgi:thiamine pyrophosphokinase
MLSHPIGAGASFTALALNHYLSSFLDRLWDRATTRTCTVGGANRVHKFFDDKPFKHPDFVVGDFDSLLPSLRKEFEQKGSKFEFIIDQDFNDLYKCLEVLKGARVSELIVVFSAIGGRLDQTLAPFSIALQRSNQQLYFLDDNNFSTWGYPGDRVIVCRQQWTTKICWLLPCAQWVRHVKTAWLKCNCNFGLGMATIVSSSNEITAGITNVMIETTDPVLWTKPDKED